MHGYLPCSVAVGYDPMLGRFTSPDSIVPEPGSVIGYNRYAYVNNNPMKYTDPSGHRIAEDPGYVAPTTYSWDYFRSSIPRPSQNDKFIQIYNTEYFIGPLSQETSIQINDPIQVGLDIQSGVNNIDTFSNILQGGFGNTSNAVGWFQLAIGGLINIFPKQTEYLLNGYSTGYDDYEERENNYYKIPYEMGKPNFVIGSSIIELGAITDQVEPVKITFIEMPYDYTYYYNNDLNFEKIMWPMTKSIFIIQNENDKYNRTQIGLIHTAYVDQLIIDLNELNRKYPGGSNEK